MARCMKIDCRQKATHSVKIVIPDKLSDRTAAEGLLGVHLCKEHLGECQTKPFFDANPGLVKLMEAIATPGTEPDVTSAYVEGIGLGSAEYKAFKNAERAWN